MKGEPSRRSGDGEQVWILLVACWFAIFWPVVEGFAQSQDFYNATFGEQIKNIVLRVERIETLVNAVILALVANFIAQIIRIRRSPGRRAKEIEESID